MCESLLRDSNVFKWLWQPLESLRYQELQGQNRYPPSAPQQYSRWVINYLPILIMALWFLWSTCPAPRSSPVFIHQARLHHSRSLVWVTALLEILLLHFSGRCFLAKPCRSDTFWKLHVGVFQQKRKKKPYTHICQDKDDTLQFVNLDCWRLT